VTMAMITSTATTRIRIINKMVPIQNLHDQRVTATIISAPAGPT
jgi:hypothetical protein